MNGADNPLIRPRNPFERRTLESIAQGKPRPVGGPFRVLPGQTSFESARSRAAANFKGRWHPTIIDETTLSVTGGTIFDGATTTIVPTTEVAINASELNYVFLQIAFATDTEDGYVTGGTVSSATIESNTTGVPANDNTTAHILLFTWENGAIVDRYEWFNFSCEFHQYGTTAGDAAIKYWIS